MLSYNSYHILWLDITSSQKQISKRGKDILKYLAISEVPSFEYDLPFTAKYRNETYVHDALNRLTDPKKRLSDYFFWLNIQSSEDKKIYVKIQNGDYQDAIKLLRPNSDRKNFAILVVLLLWEGILKGDNLVTLAKEAIAIFHEIINNDKFWKNFEKEFQLFDDLSADLWLIAEFRKNLSKDLSDIFYGIWKKLNDPSITKNFTEIFQVQWNHLHAQAEKLYIALEQNANKIAEMNISEDGVFDGHEKQQLERYIGEIRNILEEITSLWLYDSSKTKITRDIIAKSLRSITLDLYNNMEGEDDEAMKYLKIAIDLCGTEGIKDKLTQEYNLIDRRTRFATNFKSIIAYIDGEEYDKALRELDDLEKNNDIDGETKTRVKSLKQRAIFEKTGTKFVEAKKFFEEKEYSKALLLFKEVEDISEKHIYLFESINKEWLDNLIASIKEKILAIKSWSCSRDSVDSIFKEIDTIRTDVQNKLGKDEWYFVIFYIDSITYGFLSEQQQKPSGSIKPAFLYTLNGCGVFIYWDTTYFTILFIPIIPLSRWNVDSLGGNQYRFFWKKEMETWKIWWRNIGLLALGLFLLISILNNNKNSSLYSSRTNSTYSSSTYSDNGIAYPSNKGTSTDYSSSDINTTATVAWGNNKPVLIDTPRKEDDPCEKDQCYFNGKCPPKPLHATCVKDDPNNAWSCGAEYEEKDEACWCKSWKYACPSFVNSDDEDREIASLKYQIDTTQVNEYSENSVNTYNALIRKVNALTQTRNQKLNNLCSCR